MLNTLKKSPANKNNKDHSTLGPMFAATFGGDRSKNTSFEDTTPKLRGSSMACNAYLPKKIKQTAKL